MIARPQNWCAPMRNLIVELGDGYRIDPQTGFVFGLSGSRIAVKAVTTGYCSIIRTRKPCIYVHRLIWEYVHGPIQPGLDINHKNGVKTDNRIVNLELVTRAENLRHARETGLSRWLRGTDHPKCVLNESQVRKIRNLRSDGWTYHAIGKQFNVHDSTVRSIISGRSWRHLRADAEKAA